MKRSRSSEMDYPLVTKYRPRFDGSGSGEPLAFAEARELFDAYQKLGKRLSRIARISDNYQGEVKNLVLELQDAQANVRTLKGFLPICASCKKIRNDQGYWNQLEQYISEHTDVLFSHGFCPDCASDFRSLFLKSRQEPPPVPFTLAHMLDQTDLDDPVIVRYLPKVHNEHYAATPLYGDFTLLFQQYVRLAKRMRRIIRISDSYQSQLQELKTQLEQSARTDYLTGLCNRRDLYDKLAAELNRSRRNFKTSALLMADVDNFKAINDSYGHEIGDRMLVAVAEIFRTNLRKEDSCARWGGEEFLVLLPETDRESALNTAEKLRELIAGLSIDADGKGIRVTASFGVALNRPGEAVNSFIKRADEALYHAKSAGRNMSRLHGE